MTIDGMMKVTMRLAPTTTTVDSLALVIPMKTDETWLMHPVTEGLRANYAGRIPDGQGKVWDSAECPRDDAAGAVRSLYLGRRSGTRHLLVCRQRQGLPAGPADADDGDRPRARHRQPDRASHHQTVAHHPRAHHRLRPASHSGETDASTPANFRAWWPYGTKGDDDVNFNLMGAAILLGRANGIQPVLPGVPNLYDLRPVRRDAQDRQDRSAIRRSVDRAVYRAAIFG